MGGVQENHLLAAFLDILLCCVLPEGLRQGHVSTSPTKVSRHKEAPTRKRMHGNKVLHMSYDEIVWRIAGVTLGPKDDAPRAIAQEHGRFGSWALSPLSPVNQGLSKTTSLENHSAGSCLSWAEPLHSFHVLLVLGTVALVWGHLLQHHTVPMPNQATEQAAFICWDGPSGGAPKLEHRLSSANTHEACWRVF